MRCMRSFISRSLGLPATSKGEMFFLIMFFSPLLGLSGFWYVIFVLWILYYLTLTRSRNSVWGITFSLLFLFISFVKFEQFSNFSIWFSTIKFYMGWSIISLFLFLTKLHVDTNRLAILLCFEIVLEFVLINTIVPTSVLPNYPDVGYTIMTGSLVRVYSIGNNATITATILIMVLAYRESIMKRGGIACSKMCNRLISFLSFVAIIVLGSGTGYILYILFIIFKYDLYSLKHIAIFALSIIIILLFYQYLQVGEVSIFRRLTADYIRYIWELKEEQISDFIIKYKVKDPFWGANLINEETAVVWGDFAFLEFYVSLGFSGIMLFVLFVLKYINKINSFPILIGIIGTFHYGGICAFPGQLFLSYCILLNKRTFSYYSDLLRN